MERISREGQAALTAENVALFSEFASVTRDEWLAAIEATLPSGLLDSLSKRTYEDFAQAPIATAEDLKGLSHVDTLPGLFPYVRGTRAGGYHGNPWLIAQRIDIDNPRAFNQALRDSLADGQTAIKLGGSPKLETVADIAAAFADVDLGSVPLLLADAARATEIYRLLAAYLDAGTLNQLSGCVGYDPLHNLAWTGAMPSEAFERMARHIQALDDDSPSLGSIGVSSEIYHSAGANAVQELAIALGTAVLYLREMTRRDFDVNLVAGKIHFFLSVGEDFFVEVGKLRAMKMLWSQVVRAFGGDESSQRIRLHARCGSRNKSRLDVRVNMLRVTSEALAAAIGGVDSLDVMLFDAAQGESDSFSRRIARALQLILQEELRLTNLIDPSGGAWHVEKLTDQLAGAAWKLFQDMEAEGGMLAALQAGRVQSRIEAVARRRREDLARREAVLIDSNMYVNLAEDLPLDSASSREESAAVDGERIRAEPLRPLRLSAPFEALRRNAYDYRRRNGHLPRLLVLDFVNRREDSSLMAFARDFFAVGGFECVDGGRHEAAETATQALLASKALACGLCVRAGEMAEARAFIGAVKARETDYPLLVVTDAAYEASLLAAGAELVAHRQSDCLAVNEALQMRLGVR